MPLRSGVNINAADLKRFNEKMNDLRELDEEALPKVMKRTGQAVQKEMQKYAPVDTGRLRRNIDFEVLEIENKTTVEWESIAIDPETNIDYAPIQEFGGRHFRGRFYFTTAIKGAAVDLYHRIDQTIKSILRRKF